MRGVEWGGGRGKARGADPAKGKGRRAGARCRRERVFRGLAARYI